MSDALVHPSLVMLDARPRLSKYLLAGYCNFVLPVTT
jgi:hypothetical protein